MIQWLRLLPPNAGGLGLIPAQETVSHMPELKKSLHAATKKRCHMSQLRPSAAKINKQKNTLKKKKKDGRLLVLDSAGVDILLPISPNKVS